MPKLPILFSLVVAASLSARGDDALPIVHKATHDGITVTMTVDRLAGQRGTGPARERDDVVVRVEMMDEASHTPIRGVRPAVWLDNAVKGTHRDGCRERINAYAGGSFLGRADVDLNTFRVVSMNDDNTLSVVDPLFGFGGTKLLAMVALPSPAGDWTLSDDQTSIFVSAPAAKEVVRVETSGWTIAKSSKLPSSPQRLVLQPDEGYLWTATDEALVALRPRDLTVAASLPLDRGRHDLAVSHDSRTLFVTTREAGAVAVVDVAKLAVVKRIAVASPAAVSWSPKSANAYVASEAGAIVAVDRDGNAKSMKTEAGVTRVRVTPDGRYAVALNPAEKMIYVVDVVENAVVQRNELAGTPDDVAYSSSIAYITLRDSEQVQMIVLATLGTKGTPVSVAEVPGGQRGFGAETSLAPRVVQVTGEDAVLFANGPDKVIYYYREGMAAPMGNFTNYGHQPRSAMVVDRSMRERRPGVYESAARLAGPGRYDVALLVDAPKIVQCFAMTVAPDPSRLVTVAPTVQPSLLASATPIRAGQKTSLHFRLTPSSTAAAPPPLGNALVLIFAPGVWQGREEPRPAADGTYVIDFTPPAAGSYSAYVLAPSVGLDYALAGTVQVQ
jgi:hypothetical protein